MRIYHNALHEEHRGQSEMYRGRLVPCHEVPERLEHVLRELERRPVGARTVPEEPPGLDAALARLHGPRYLEFLATAWRDWVALDPSNAERDLLPSVWPGPDLRRDVEPWNFAARIGLYTFDAGTPIMAGTWRAARAGAACSIAAARGLARERHAFVLTRPPGHHAGADSYGGYCFLNNAALAAEELRQNGAARVAVLDIDYHHGNGTQSLFYERADVLTVSIHGDPRSEYPFFLGHADERGRGPGSGLNLNLPLPRGADFDTWREALELGLEAVRAFEPEALVVPLGVDTFEGDPISGFTLQSPDYLTIGACLAELGLPTLFTFEGGYAVAEVGVNVVNVLEGFLG